MSNLGQVFSQKIAPDGLVICCTDYVVGGDTYFRPASNNGKWVAYQNGQMLPRKMASIMTMKYAASIFREYK